MVSTRIYSPAVALMLITLINFVSHGAEANKFSGGAYKTCTKEKQAQELVAQLLKDRRSGTSAGRSPSDGLQDWVPAVSLEAEQGKLPHQQLEREFREQFEEVIGAGDLALFEEDLKGILKDLEYTFMTFTKNEYGDVGHTAVRYALHRLFVARHGWYIKGLDPEGDAYSSSSPAEVLKNQVPDTVYVVIEKLLYGRGFGLYETAVLAAVLETMIHKEAIYRTAFLFGMFNMSLVDKHPAASIDFAIENFMAAYIMGQDVTAMTTEQANALMKSMPQNYPGWKDTQTWIHEIRSSHGSGGYTFNETVSVITEIGEKYGKWQQQECSSMKKQLMELESMKNGCVPVSNFYKSMLHDGKWQYSESPDYLRELGALDDSDPANLKVMIPNYLDGASNCVAGSGYYSVCCLNECEEILGHIEQYIQAPDASPDELSYLVAMLPSSTVQANRTLSASLLRQLVNVGEVHGGRVPLHSRLFLQWMHNAYPHECPYPHAMGTTAPRTPEVWMAETGKASIASNEVMEGFIANASANSQKQTFKNAQCGQWLEVEELYVPWGSRQRQLEELETRDEYVWAMSSTLALLGVVASTMLMVLHNCKSVRRAAIGSSKKHITS